MVRLEEVLTRISPEKLYHYTSSDGVLNILKNRTVWATNIHYLNDTQELFYAVEQIQNIIGSYAKEDLINTKKSLYSKLREALEAVQSYDLCIFSLTEDRNLLSQWRGYCPPAGGYSLGFEIAKLKPLMKAQGFLLVPCIYDCKMQNDLLVQIIEGTIRHYYRVVKAGWTDERVLLSCQYYFICKLVLVGPMIKHPSFSEEREWRMISTPKKMTETTWGFRAGKYMIVPHSIFHLDEMPDDFPITELIVGPTPYPNLSQRSLDHYIKSLGLNIQVICSDIPYRDW